MHTAQALLCAEQENMQEVVPLGPVYKSVRTDHHLSFPIGVIDPPAPQKGGNDVNSLFWLLRWFGALLCTTEPLWGAGNWVPSASIAGAGLGVQGWIPTPGSPKPSAGSNQEF